LKSLGPLVGAEHEDYTAVTHDGSGSPDASMDPQRPCPRLPVGAPDNIQSQTAKNESLLLIGVAMKPSSLLSPTMRLKSNTEQKRPFLIEFINGVRVLARPTLAERHS